MQNKLQIEFTEQQLEQIAVMNKYYPQFMKIINSGCFEKEFTGRIIVDILRGEIKNLKRITNIHFEVRL